MLEKEAADPDEIEYDEYNRRWVFKPRGLHITMSSDSSYWKMPEKGTHGSAELLKICWIEIQGSSPEPLSKGERYALSFRISLTEENFGWSNVPAFMMAKVGKKGRAEWAKIHMEDVKSRYEKEVLFGYEMEVPFGKLRFQVPKNAEDTLLSFGFYELWTGRWKGGLRIHGAVLEQMPD